MTGTSADESSPSAPPFGRGRTGLWVVAVVVLLGVVYVAWRYVGTLSLGLFVYYVTRPVLRRFSARIPSRTLAVGVALLTVALPVLVLVGWALLVAVQAFGDFLQTDLAGQFGALLGPGLVQAADTLRTFVTVAVTDPQRLTDLELAPIAAGVGGLLSGSLTLLFGVAIHVFVALLVAFYLLRDDYRIARWARDTFTDPDGVVEAYLVRVDRDLEKVFFGNILNALLTGLIAAVTFFVLNAVAPSQVLIPEAGLLGLLVGAASLIPVVGIKLVTVPTALYLFARAALLDPGALWFPAVFVVVSFVVVDYIPDQLLRPYVSGRSLHVGAIMVAYTLGPLLFGWYGIFLAPLLLVVVFEFTRYVLPWLLDGTVPVERATPDERPGAANERADRSVADSPASDDSSSE